MKSDETIDEIKKIIEEDLPNKDNIDGDFGRTELTISGLQSSFTGVIRNLVKTFPNDMELGGKIRALFWESKPHYPSKEMRDSWNESQS